MNILLYILYFIGFIVSYRLLRIQYNKDFGTSWAGVLVCAVGALLSWGALIIWLVVSNKLSDIKLPKPPTWL